MFFSLDEVQIRDDIARVALNVIPLSQEETVAIFSYASSDAALARMQLGGILNSNGEHQKYELSKIMIERTENFAISPAHVRRWSREKSEAVKNAFIENLFLNKIKDDMHLMLF